MTGDDMHSLESRLIEEALQAHLRVAKGCGGWQRDTIEADATEKFANKVLAKIREGRRNARPHVRERI